MILDYLGGPNIITRVFIRQRQGGREKRGVVIQQDFGIPRWKGLELCCKTNVHIINATPVYT